MTAPEPAATAGGTDPVKALAEQIAATLPDFTDEEAAELHALWAPHLDPPADTERRTA